MNYNSLHRLKHYVANRLDFYLFLFEAAKNLTLVFLFFKREACFVIFSNTIYFLN
jgi:hypothetical protein